RPREVGVGHHVKPRGRGREDRNGIVAVAREEEATASRAESSGEALKRRKRPVTVSARQDVPQRRGNARVQVAQVRSIVCEGKRRHQQNGLTIDGPVFVRRVVRRSSWSSASFASAMKRAALSSSAMSSTSV